HVVRLDARTRVTLEAVGQTATQLSLTQGNVAATVAALKSGESFEIGTPNLAFRARQPGEYRFDVDSEAGTTRVWVQSGAASVYGDHGETLELRTGQRVTFRERSLAKVATPAFAATDD